MRRYKMSSTYTATCRDVAYMRACMRQKHDNETTNDITHLMLDYRSFCERSCGQTIDLNEQSVDLIE